MNQINYKLLNKIRTNMLAQFPPCSLVESNNAWINKYNNFSHNHKKRRYKCLLHNHECNGIAINSHSIPKKNLKMMSNHCEVYTLKDNFKNPFKSNLSTSNIRYTLTFFGFCKYHDNSLFQGIENKNIAQYDNEDVFFLSYRAMAKEYSDNRELIEKYSWILDNWNSEEKKQLDKETAFFQADRMKNLDKTVAQRKRICLATYFQIRVFDKLRVKNALRICQIQGKHLKRKLENFNTLINNKETFKSHYVMLQNQNQIAFSTAYNFSINKKEVFLYCTSLPQKDGSFMILSCSKSDYEHIKNYSDIKQLFSGDESTINEFLNYFKEKIAIDGTDIDLNFAHPFFLEWDIPLAKIPYFKKKEQ